MRNPRVTSNRLREKTWRKFLAGLAVYHTREAKLLADLANNPVAYPETAKDKEKIVSAMEAQQ